jgi:hypothetical protein
VPRTLQTTVGPCPPPPFGVLPPPEGETEPVVNGFSGGSDRGTPAPEGETEPAVVFSCYLLAVTPTNC